MSGSGIYTPGFESSSGFDPSSKPIYFFSLFGPELNGLNFLEPKSIFGEMVIVLFYSGHSVPHLEFQNGGGFGPHLRERRMAPTRVGPLWVYPAGIKPKCERAPLT